MNMIFHIAASVAFVGMFWLLYKMQSQRDLLRLTLRLAMPEQSRNGLKRISVDWPQKFLIKFCESVSIPIESESKTEGNPAKINQAVLVEFMLRCGIKNVRLNDLENSEKSQSKLAEIIVIDHEKIKGSDENELSKAIAMKVILGS